VFNDSSFGFLSPAEVLRASHVMPAFSRDRLHPDGRGFSKVARDSSEWVSYYVGRFVCIPTSRDYVSYIQYRFVDRDMMMRYHHFLGIGHTYSDAFRPTCPSPCSTSAHETIGTCVGNQDQDQEISDLPPASQRQTRESEDLSDADSINMIDNGWRGWDNGDGEDDGDDVGGHESNGDLLDMDNMYGS
jgi:hypothetical protein